MHGTIQTKRDEIEEKLKVIWKEILQLPDVGIHDNFFEKGGHSLKALELEVRIGVEFNIEVSLENIFSHLTIRELADYICNSQEDRFSLIQPAPDKPYYPVSWVQRKMYFSYFDGLENAVMDIRRVDHDIDPYELERAFHTIIKRHKSLRTTFEIREEEVVQIVHDESEWFRIKCWEAPQEEAEQEAFIRQCVEEINRPYTLNQLPLFRIGLVRVPEQGCLLIIHFHHIIFDAYSIKLVYHELDCISQGRLLPNLSLQYVDYCTWQSELESSEKYKETWNFWFDLFSGELPQLNLPLDRPRSNRLISTYGNKNIFLDRDLVQKIQHISKRVQVTPSIFLTAVYGLFLSKYSAQNDITMGILSSRRYSGLENSIGVFIRPVPIRFQVTSNQTLAEYFQQVKKIFISALEYQECDVNELEEAICRLNGVSKTDHPLYRVSMNFHTELESVFESLIGAEGDTLRTGNAQDIACGVYFLDSGELCLNMEYNMELFDHSTIKRMGDHFVCLLQAVLSEPERRISEMSLLSVEERHKIMYKFNSNGTDFASDQTLHAIFEQQVGKYGNNLAVCCADRSLTYRELNKKANQLARVLVAEGVGPGVVVGIMLERSVEMMVGLLAILKAGGAYLPISADYPPDRVAFVLEDSQAKIVLVDGKTEMSRHVTGVVSLNVQDTAIYRGEESDLAPRGGSRDLAYIMYTSGSTGHPKGVMIEHRSVINRLAWMHKQFPIGEDDCILQKTPFTFDVSVWELFGWYFNGARVSFLQPDMEKDPEFILATIARERVTLMHFVPSMLNSFLSYVEPRMAKEADRLSSLRYLFVSGEALLPNTVNVFNRLVFSMNGTRLINLYGPTETTIEVSWFDCSEGYEESEPRTIVPIGKPIDNIRMYIVDNEENLQPIGVPGELLISGIGVGRGYVNRPDITAQKFVDDPWNIGSRMYRSGDLARWMPDGNIEYLGRIDEQVKIRGVRIELGEIENISLQLETVEAVAAAVKENGVGDKSLCLYYVPTHELDAEELKRYLVDRLPRLMVPDYFIEVAKIPLNASGKVNRKLLPTPDVQVNQGTVELPASEIEKKLAEICQKVLHVEKIGIHTNLFSVGANSLKIILIATRIRQEMNTDIPVSDVYTKPTIAEMAAYMQSEEVPSVSRNDHDLVLIHKGKADAPNLFLIHDISGSIDAYLELAKSLDGRFTCYGIPAEIADSQKRYGVTMETLAKTYLEKMKIVQPDGPYSLAGWSMGGVLAFEITRQLEAAGEEVNILALIDSSHPKQHHHLQTPNEADLEIFRRKIEQAVSDSNLIAEMCSESTLYGQYKKVAQYMEENGLGYEALEILIPKEILQAIPEYAQRNQVNFYHYVNLFIDLQNAYVHYNPSRKVFAQAYLIKAKESLGVEEKGWNAFFYSPISFHEIEGDHFSIFREPDLGGLAAVFEIIGLE